MKTNRPHRSLTHYLISAATGVIIFVILHFSNKTSLTASLAISAGAVLIAALIQYMARLRSFKWKENKMPEVVIVNGTITVNGKSTVFQGNDKWLRKAQLKENDEQNILCISFEWKSGNDIYSDEVNIPVPKGKLREAMELLDTLNLKIDLLTVFS